MPDPELSDAVRNIYHGLVSAVAARRAKSFTDPHPHIPILLTDEQYDAILRDDPSFGRGSTLYGRAVFRESDVIRPLPPPDRPAPSPCNRSTLRGGAGVDDASGLTVFWCSRAPGHAGNCRFDRTVGSR